MEQTMTTPYRNNFIRGSRSLAGDQLITCITRSGKIIMMDKPMFNDRRAVTDPQKSRQDALREAVAYARFAESEDVYINKARKTGATAYNLAIVDWLGAPKVLEINVDDWIGKIGQTIRVKARDNVMVARVEVVIRDANEKVLEMGTAVQSEEGSVWWTYTTQALVTMTPFPSVEAIAQDLPGNIDSFVLS
jgi:hypothetical protein